MKLIKSLFLLILIFTVCKNNPTNDWEQRIVYQNSFEKAEDIIGWVAFDTQITPDLKIEGMMRELLRRLQVLRKDIGLEIEDRIVLTYQTESEQIHTLFKRFETFLCSELLANSIESGSADGGKGYNLDGEEVSVFIRKAPLYK